MHTLKRILVFLNWKNSNNQNSCTIDSDAKSWYNFHDLSKTSRRIQDVRKSETSSLARGIVPLDFKIYHEAVVHYNIVAFAGHRLIDEQNNRHCDKYIYLQRTDFQ